MNTSTILRSILLLLTVAIGATGCIEIPISIGNIQGSFDRANFGLDAGIPFEEGVDIDIQSIDLSDLIQMAQDDIGGAAANIEITNVMIDNFLFEADPGMDFSFVTEIEISFLEDGAAESQRTIIATATDPNGFGATLEVASQSNFDLLPFLTTQGTGGQLTLQITGTTPDGPITWISTINLTLMVSLG